MKVRALRGVCIGVGQHLAPGDTVDLPAAEVPFLAGIGAVEPVADDPAPAPEDTKTETAGKPGKKEK
jgi:hypothetical protein